VTWADRLRELAAELERARSTPGRVDAVARRLSSLAATLDGWSAAPTATCAGPACGRPIVWVKLGGRAHPCDPALVSIVVDGRIVRGRQSHYATCPNAEDFRRQDLTR
jgi:hypothetical protein